MSKYTYITTYNGSTVTTEKIRKATLISKLKKKLKIKINLPKIPFYSKNKRYWCEDRKRWVDEYRVIRLFTVYKLVLNTKMTKWSLISSKNKMTKARDTTPVLTKQEAIEEFGTNKWTYPLEPYRYEK